VGAFSPHYNEQNQMYRGYAERSSNAGSEFDEHAWLQPSRTRAFVVYCVAFLGGFLVVFILAAVLFGGYQVQRRPLDLPPPAVTSSQ